MRIFAINTILQLKKLYRTLKGVCNGDAFAARRHLQRMERAFLQRSEGPDATWSLTLLQQKSTHPRGGRSVIRATAPDGRDSVVAKIYDTPNHAQEKLQALRHFANISAHCIKPRFAMPKHNILVMNDAGDKTALTLMDSGQEGEGFEMALRWLQDYTADAACGVKPFNSQPFIDQMQTMATYLSPKKSQRLKPWLDQTTTRLRAFEGLPLSHIQSFGDPSPDNICILNDTGKRVGIDGIQIGEMPVEHDIAFLLKHCRERHWRRSLQKSGFIDRSLEQRDAKAIKIAFGDAVDWSLVNVLLDTHLIFLWRHVKHELLIKKCIEQRLNDPDNTH